MSEAIDNPLHQPAVDSALARMDIEGMAAKSNALTGGCLRGQDALKVARMVCFAALRSPHKIITVAGIQGRYAGDRLFLAYSADLIAIEIPSQEEL